MPVLLRLLFFKTLIYNPSNAIVLVCEDESLLRGFVIANLNEAPPVYAPGGRTCLFDEFTVTQTVVAGEPAL